MGPASSPDMTRSTKRRALNSDGLFHSQETGQRPGSHGRRRSRWYGQDGCRRRSQRHSHGRIRSTQRIHGCGSSKLRHSHGRRRSNWTRDRRFFTCNVCEQSWTSSSIVTDCLGSTGRTINRMSKNKHVELHGQNKCSVEHPGVRAATSVKKAERNIGLRKSCRKHTEHVP